MRRVWSWGVRAPGVGRGEVGGVWILTAPISPGDVESLGLNQIPNTIAAKVKNSEGRTKVGYGAIG